MRLFKYFPPDRLDVLTSGRICFSAPTNLNDPFELKPLIQLFDSGEFVRQNLAKMVPEQIEKALNEFPAYVDRSVARAAMLQHMDATIAIAVQAIMKAAPQIQREVHTKIATVFGMLCLTEKHDNLLMWAHYSASHTGFVLEFDTEHPYFDQRQSAKDECRYLRKVEYALQRPLIGRDSLVTTSLLLTKSHHWEYEQEWRMFLPLTDAATVITAGSKQYHLFDYPRDSIKSVFLGCRMDPGHREEILSILRTVPELGKPACLQALEDEKLFALRFEPIEY